MKITLLVLFFLLFLVACGTVVSSQSSASIDSEAEEIVDNKETTAVDNTTSITETEPAPPALASHLPDMGLAPEIHNDVWVNTETPVTLASQRGKVVLLEFWTFG